MTELRVDHTHVEVAMSGWEQLGALRREVRFPLRSIASVQRVDVARDHVRGIRAPGTGIPGGLLLGTWRGVRFSDFVALTGRHAGYVIELTDERFDRLVIGSDRVPELDALID